MTPFEAVVASKLIEQGYEVLTCGWPDFCAIRVVDGATEVRIIEVKGRGDALRPSQKKVHRILNLVGLEVEVIQEDAQHRMQCPPDVAAGVRVARKHRGGRPAMVTQKAIPYLQSRLSDGPVRGSVLVRNASEFGISRSTLYRLALDLRIVRSTRDGEVYWELPAPEEEKKL